MPLLKLLHFAALVGWCGLLLYLPTLLAAAARDADPVPSGLARQLFVTAATPAALLAIATGTALFLADGIVALWLVAKLGMVTGMVLCHLTCGALILRAEQATAVSRGPGMLGALTAAFVGATLWLALAKPF